MKPKVRLVGENGNIFNLLGIARGALRDAGQPEKATELCSRIQTCHSYAEALATICEYVDAY